MQSNIRNFVIIAHVDHGKSTLADRLLEITGTVPERLMRPQYLDQLELERERGITIKMAPVRMICESEILNLKSQISDQKYILNLIDTPGHSDFRYEVSRALAAVEGAILLVDATQGIQAQTLANAESARKAGLTIIGAVNKIDAASPEQVEVTIAELAEYLGAAPDDILRVSGKTGAGVPELLEAVIERIPPPEPINRLTDSPISQSSRALIFDSIFDDHKGVIAFVRVFNGSFERDDTARLAATGAALKVKEVGMFQPKLAPCETLGAGEIGYLATGIKDTDKIKIGDTVFANLQSPVSNLAPLPGYAEPKPVVFVSFYPDDADRYEDLKKSLAKLRLTDSSLRFEPDASEVLGRGFKAGFLGQLHFEITAERLEREFGVKTTHSFPSVAYRARMDTNPPAGGGRIDTNRESGEAWRTITNPKDFTGDYAEVQEPMTDVEILTPMEFLSSVLGLKELFRFSDIRTKQMGSKVFITARLPLADLIRDLDDKLKSVSQGFASLNYEVTGWERADVQKIEILVAGNAVPGLTRILPRKDVEREARIMVERLKDLLPKQQFAQAIQAASGGRIIARETIPAMRKELGNFGKTGGDRTRKMKLWQKQQKGKERLAERGAQSGVTVPASVFRELLKR